MPHDFFYQANKIIQKGQLKRQESYKRGEYFNVFSVMHMESDEVFTHSAVLSNLLDPNGSHGCGDIFLKLFIETIQGLDSLEYETLDSTSNVEVSIGKVNLKDEEGGRMDIVLQSKGKAIIIENKIYAGDQPEQMLRYCKYAQSHFQQFKLLYLTLNAKEPSAESTHDGQIKSGEDFECISYAAEIRSWLDKCIEKSALKPTVRETLVQYKKLIDKLTHNNMETEMKQELLQLCMNPANIEAAYTIYSSFASIMNEMMNSKFVPQVRALAKELELEVYFKDDSNNNRDWMNTKWMGFYFRKKNWTSYEIGYEFQSISMNSLGSGIRYQDKISRTHDDIYAAICDLDLASKHTQGWPIFKRWQINNNWVTADVIKLLSDSNQPLLDIIKKDLQYYIQLVEEHQIKM